MVESLQISGMLTCTPGSIVSVSELRSQVLDKNKAATKTQLSSYSLILIASFLTRGVEFFSITGFGAVEYV